MHALDRDEIYLNFILIAAVVLSLSIITAYFFSNRKAKREGHTLFDHTAIRVLINLCIPKEFKSKDFSDLVKNIDNIDTDIFSTGKKQTIKDKIKLIWQCNIQLPF